MQECLKTNRSQMLTLKQFAEKNPWPSAGTLRNLFYASKRNGLEKAFVKIGRRIIVDEEVFFQLIRAKREN